MVVEDEGQSLQQLVKLPAPTSFTRQRVYRTNTGIIFARYNTHVQICCEETTSFNGKQPRVLSILSYYVKR